MSFESLEQNFANSTGFILDRTVEPPVVLGLAFIISKNRAAACASCLYNYVEAPWAVAINFPHADLVVGVKAITLHPDFDLKTAHAKYLAQTGLPDNFSNVQLNDLATVALDMQLAPLPMEKMTQLSNHLTLPLPNLDIETSGVINGDNFLSVVTALLESEKAGLLTLYGERNLPIAQIQLEAGSIKRVYFNTLYNEMAFSELVFRKPAARFIFQKQDINWDAVKTMSIMPANLMTEAKRRAAELPALLEKMGGKQARYQQAIVQFNIATITNANIHKLVEKLWLSLDGYITVEKLGQKIGVDTYSIVQGLRELVNYGAISLLNRASLFTCGKQLGNPIVSHMDFDINPGDPLTAFYLDPLSGAPVWRQGNFAGVASVLHPKNLLHTISIDSPISGALILKNYKLIGVHNGSMPPKVGAGDTTTKPSQMIWIGALLDMGARRSANAETQERSGPHSSLSGLRSLAPAEVSEPIEQLEKYVCPACYSTNTQIGPCFNCGSIIETPVEELQPTGLTNKFSLASLQALKERYGITNKQLIIAGSILLLVAWLGMILSSGEHTSETTPLPASTIHHDSAKAVDLAVTAAGFKSEAPPGYWYEDTSEITKPAKSFGLYSQSGNQKVLFVLFDDLAPVLALPDFINRPLFSGVSGPATATDMSAKVDQGSQILGSGNLSWYVGRYTTATATATETATITTTEADQARVVVILVGSFPAKIETKSFLVIGQNFDNGISYDYKSALWLIDHMAQEFTVAGNQKRLGGETATVKDNNTGTLEQENVANYATEEEIKIFLGQLKERLQAQLSLPEKAQEELKKEQSKKLKATLILGIDNAGNVKKMEFTESSEWESVNNALVRDINACAPYTNVPKTKDDLLKIVVSLRRDIINVELP